MTDYEIILQFIGDSNLPPHRRIEAHAALDRLNRWRWLWSRMARIKHRSHRNALSGVIYQTKQVGELHDEILRLKVKATQWHE